MKVFDHETLLRLNRSSIQAGRSQNLKPEQIPGKPQDRYWVTAYQLRARNGQEEVRICVVLNIFAGRTAWLDLAPEEVVAIPSIEVSMEEWEAAMCAGTPRLAP